MRKYNKTTTHILMHKNHEVAELQLTESNSLISYNKIMLGEHIPFPVNRDIDSTKLFDVWMQSRQVPASRLRPVETRFRGLSNKLSVERETLALSLADHYWLKPANSNLTWGSVNLFTNTFDDTLGVVLAAYEMQTSQRQRIQKVIPYITNTQASDNTGGVMPKLWLRQNNKPVLVKFADNQTEFQTLYNEVIAYNFLKGFAPDKAVHNWIQMVDIDELIEQRLKEKNREELSPIRYNSVAADIFTTEDIELIHAEYLLGDDNSTYDSFLQWAESVGVPDVRDSLEELVITDYLFENTDRHTFNWGLLRNSETLEWLGVAPFYDNGLALQGDCPITYLMVGLGQYGAPMFNDTDTTQEDLVKKVRNIKQVIEKIQVSPPDMYKMEFAKYFSKERSDKILEMLSVRYDRLLQLAEGQVDESKTHSFS